MKRKGKGLCSDQVRAQAVEFKFCKHNIPNCVLKTAHFSRDRKMKAVCQTGTQQATVHRHCTHAEPKKYFLRFVAIRLPALHYGYPGQYTKRTSAFM